MSVVLRLRNTGEIADDTTATLSTPTTTQDLLRGLRINSPTRREVSGGVRGHWIDKQVPGVILPNEQTAESQSPNSDGTLPY